MSASRRFLVDPRNEDFLAGRTQRTAALRDARVLIGVLVLFLGIGAIPLSLTLGGRLHRWLWLQGDGADAVGQVTVLKKGEDRWYVTYQFEVDTATGPRTVSSTQWIDEGQAKDLRPGQPLPIRYSRSNPVITTCAPDNLFAGILVISLFLSVWTGIFAIMLGWQLRVYRREQRLIQQGTLLEGQVDSCEENPYSDDEDGGFRLHYRFATPAGTRVETETVARHGRNREARPAAETPLAVLYLNEKQYRLL